MFNLHQTSYVWLKCFPEDIYMPISTYSHSATSWQQEFGTYKWFWYIPSIFSSLNAYCSPFPVFLKPPLAVSPGARSLSSLLAALIRTEHRWCEDPIESAPFIIIIIIIISKLNRFWGPKHARKVRKLCTRPRSGENLRLIWVSKVGVAKWLDSATYTLSTECTSNCVSRTSIKVGTLM